MYVYECIRCHRYNNQANLRMKRMRFRCGRGLAWVEHHELTVKPLFVAAIMGQIMMNIVQSCEGLDFCTFGIQLVVDDNNLFK